MYSILQYHIYISVKGISLSNTYYPIFLLKLETGQKCINKYTNQQKFLPLIFKTYF